MQNQLEQRLETLKAEFEAGQKMLEDLEARQATLHETLLRISGAIQVLEELLETTDVDIPGDGQSEMDHATMASEFDKS